MSKAPPGAQMPAKLLAAAALSGPRPDVADRARCRCDCPSPALASLLPTKSTLRADCTRSSQSVARRIAGCAPQHCPIPGEVGDDLGCGRASPWQFSVCPSGNKSTIPCDLLALAP